MQGGEQVNDNDKENRPQTAQTDSSLFSIRAAFINDGYFV
jgi:hypothetical protein